MTLYEMLAQLLVVALAADAVGTAWFQEGGLFAGRRARYEAGTGPLAKLLTCRVCFTYHAAGWLLLLCYVPAWLLTGPWRHVALLPAYWLAATTLAHLTNTHTKRYDDERDARRRAGAGGHGGPDAGGRGGRGGPDVEG